MITVEQRLAFLDRLEVEVKLLSEEISKLNVMNKQLIELAETLSMYQPGTKIHSAALKDLARFRSEM